MQLRRAHNTEVQMNEKFFDLAREKQDRMINGAIEVFAKTDINTPARMIW